MAKITQRQLRALPKRERRIWAVIMWLMTADISVAYDKGGHVLLNCSQEDGKFLWKNVFAREDDVEEDENGRVTLEGHYHETVAEDFAVMKKISLWRREVVYKQFDMVYEDLVEEDRQGRLKTLIAALAK